MQPLFHFPSSFYSSQLTFLHFPHCCKHLTKTGISIDRLRLYLIARLHISSSKNRLIDSLTYVCTAANATCAHNQFQCKDGTCLKNSTRCNKKIDCKDKSDELNCYTGYKTRKIRGSLRISNLAPPSPSIKQNKNNFTAAHFELIKHAEKKLSLLETHKKILKWGYHCKTAAKLCRSVSSTSFFLKKIYSLFPFLAGFNYQLKKFKSTEILTIAFMFFCCPVILHLFF